MAAVTFILFIYLFIYLCVRIQLLQHVGLPSD
jgi:hypothetical protein